jgi:LmbE family N-acetylglucosaminyl deacetylase
MWLQGIDGIGAVIAGLVAAASPQTPPDLAGKRIMTVQAHPDDEQNLAPMLAEACRFQGASCQFLLVADGPGPGCAVVTLFRHVTPMRDFAKCAETRRAEMRDSARLIGGEARFLGLDDLFYAYDDAGVARTIDGWSEAKGGREALVAAIADEIRRARPQVIFALDPRHGSSCHAGHRAVSLLLVEALATLPAEERPEVWLEETTDLGDGLSAAEAAEQENGGLFVWRTNTAPVAWYDGAKTLPDGTQAHAVRDAVHRVHKTQDLTPDTPIVPPSAERMRIPLVRLADIDPREDLCTGLALKRPTFDVPGNRERFMARLEAAGR